MAQCESCLRPQTSSRLCYLSENRSKARQFEKKIKDRRPKDLNSRAAAVETQTNHTESIVSQDKVTIIEETIEEHARVA